MSTTKSGPHNFWWAQFSQTESTETGITRAFSEATEVEACLSCFILHPESADNSSVVRRMRKCSRPHQHTCEEHREHSAP